ncbi:MAG TPA: hypothetical protein VJT08_22050 [Terriglobales bacterium]|nr:hypothetical protein [Terriglobales bacterium]
MIYQKQVASALAAILLLFNGLVWAQNLPSSGATAESCEVVKSSSDLSAPVQLAPAAIIRSFHLLLGRRELIPRVLGAYGIQAIVDQSVSSQTVPFDASDVDFADAVRLEQLATNTFLVPLTAHQALVVDGSRQNRAKYQHQITETVHFSGITSHELSDMENIARNVFGLEHAVMHPSQETITVRAPEAELDPLNTVYAELLHGHSELLLEVHAYEVDRKKETNSGVILPSSATLFNVRSAANSVLANNAVLVQEIIQSGEAAAGDWQKILAILIASGALSGTVFNNPFVVFGGGLTETGAEWNTSAANMLLDSSDVRSINQIQLRVLDQEEATFRVGERYPIMSSAYSIRGVAPGSSSQTTPQVQYVDLGLTLKAKPYIGGSAEVTLRLEFDLDTLAGSSLNNIPVLTNRQYSSVISVHPGNSALLVSALSNQDSRELTGVPGLSDFPGPGDASNRQHTAEDRELVILLTPHVVRTAYREASGRVLPMPEQ